ncbi:hypothetical protein [Salipiger mucosus]|uniref:STAS domain-containing protein n=1 Tax=Salipiger mucosus DSM 16094 TaxID=1123237 RepID=S9QB95_9RHOB|nr:hypothetical protein [Salipiger mucosus]EPX78656.1 hypothetical protein Salmuc_04237 [Salipiger mucosus DSM 16094]
MASLTISEIADARDRLACLLADGGSVVRLSPDDTLDACGAQLLACAIRTAEGQGRTLTVEMPEDGPAVELWQSLALDTVATPVPVAVAPVAEVSE